MRHVKIKEVGRVEYVIDMDRQPDKIKFMWKKGKMYLSMSDVIINSNNRWYELPVDAIDDVSIDENGMLIIDFKNGSIKIVSKDINSLKVMRYFLLPYILGEREK